MLEHDPSLYGRQWAEDYDVYERYDRSTAAAVARLLELAAGRPMLEVAAGTGRVALPMARAGARVTATDISPEMIAVLRRKDTAGCVDARVEGMQEITGGPYGLIANINNSILMLTDPALQARAIASAAAALQTGGHLIVETAELAPRPMEPRVAAVEQSVPATIWADWDAATSIKIIYSRLPDGEVRSAVLRRLGHAELVAAALAAGLEVAAVELDDWSGRPLLPDAAEPHEKLIFIFRRPQLGHGKLVRAASVLHPPDPDGMPGAAVSRCGAPGRCRRRRWSRMPCGRRAGR